MNKTTKLTGEPWAVSELRHAEMFLIRHAPVAGAGRLAGRLDLPADLSNQAGFSALAARLPEGAMRTSSPARRCLMTAEALMPALEAEISARRAAKLSLAKEAAKRRATKRKAPALEG